MATTWLTADNHFGHSRILEYCARPFASVGEMDRAMVERWDARVRPGDTVVHLGDFALTSRERIADLVDSLAGHKVLLLGNHDRSATAMRACGFDEVHKGEYEVEGVRCVHDPDDARPGETTLAGHVHGLYDGLLRKDGARIINVGVDVRRFAPATLEELLGTEAVANPPPPAAAGAAGTDATSAQSSAGMFPVRPPTGRSPSARPVRRGLRQSRPAGGRPGDPHGVHGPRPAYRRLLRGRPGGPGLRPLRREDFAGALHRRELLRREPETVFGAGMGVREVRRAVALFSLQSSREQVVQRMISLTGNLPVRDLRDLRGGSVRAEDWPKLLRSVFEVSRAPLFVNDSTSLSLREMRAALEEVRRGLDGTEVELGLVVVDDLRLMLPPTHSDEEREGNAASVLRGLKVLARDLRVPVLLLAQLPRTLERRFDRRPLLTDFAPSEPVEGFADTVAFLYRDEIYDPDTDDRGVAEVIVAKQRSGPTGKVLLAFLESFGRFASLARR